MESHKVSERRACRALNVSRSTYRYEAVVRDDEEAICQAIMEKATNYGRAGYRMVTHMLRNEGIIINHKKVERIWRELGLKLPSKQPRKARIWLNDGSCVRLRPEYKNHVWSYDFMEDSTYPDGRRVRYLNILDEAESVCLASIPRRSWRSRDVVEVLADLMIIHGSPEYIRSDNGPEFTAKAVREWLSNMGVITTYIEPGSPWENGYIESFNGKMRTEFLNLELFGSLKEAEILTERWVKYYNTIRPHSRFGGRPPAPQSVIPKNSLE